MNAHGLFKKLKNGLPIESKWDLVVIIDKQEKRIAELEKERTRLFEAHSVEMIRADKNADRIAEFEEKLLSLKHRYKALSHPVKQLSDEEMYKLAEQCGFNVDGKAINDGIETAADFHSELFMFARAIIKEITE